MNGTHVRNFIQFAIKVVVVHTVTYAAFGFVMSTVFGYQRVFEQEIVRDYMRPFNSPFVYAGPLLQPLRGLVMAIALWLIRPVIFEWARGWLMLWLVIVLLAIIAAPSAAPNSIERVIYTKLPLWYHLVGLPELLLQTLTFSFVLHRWVTRQPKTQPSPRSRGQLIFIEMIRAVMTGCFASIGYAIGGLSSVALANIALDFNQAASDVRCS